MSLEQRRVDVRDRGHKLLPLLREIHWQLLARRDAWREKGSDALADSCEQSAYNVASLMGEIVEGAEAKVLKSTSGGANNGALGTLAIHR